MNKFVNWLRKNLVFAEAVYQWQRSLPTWVSWVAHGLISFGATLAFGSPGGYVVVGFYTGKEYKESDSLDNIRLDNVMDWVSPILGFCLASLLR